MAAVLSVVCYLATSDLPGSQLDGRPNKTQSTRFAAVYLAKVFITLD